MVDPEPQEPKLTERSRLIRDPRADTDIIVPDAKAGDVLVRVKTEKPRHYDAPKGDVVAVVSVTALVGDGEGGLGPINPEKLRMVEGDKAAANLGNEPTKDSLFGELVERLRGKYGAVHIRIPEGAQQMNLREMGRVDYELHIDVPDGTMLQRVEASVRQELAVMAQERGQGLGPAGAGVGV